MPRLPIPGSDDGTWGDILNEFLEVSLDTDGTLKDSAKSDKVSKGGDTMTGDLTLAGAPSSGLHAVTKAYVDSLTLSGSPDADATTKGLVQLAGDLSGTAGSPSIASNAVTNAKAADMAQATLKGRASGAGTGDPTDLTATQARTILNVEDGADATDAANVDAAGAVMNSDTSTASMSFVVDEDNMISDSATKVPTQQSVKAYADSVATTAATNLSTHASDTTSVHGITDTSALETTTGAQAKADAKVADAINDGTTTIAPSQNAVYDALALKADAADLTNHFNDTVDAHDASAISFSPTGTVAATDVQAAIAEVASETSGAATTDSGGSVETNKLQDKRFSYHQRAASLYLTQSSTVLVKEIWIGDSTSHAGASAPETTSAPAIYEREMARMYNGAPRTVGYMPARLWTPVLGEDSPGIKWDTLTGGTMRQRGPSYSNYELASGDSMEVTRNGTHVTIYYTAKDSGGAVATVTINDVVQGTTIDSTDASITTTYDSGRASTTYARPNGGYGSMKVNVAFTSGTAIEIEGAYFHNTNNTTGHMLLRAATSGQTIQNLISAGSPSVLQVIGNQQPQIVTIAGLGINDQQPGGLNHDSATIAADLQTLITSINAKYSTWKPTIRYLFPYKGTAGYFQSTWDTTYRAALRQVCTDNDVLFVDAREATGNINSSDYLDVSDDGLHPNDRGHAAWGYLLAHLSSRTGGTQATPLLANRSFQQITAASGIVRFSNGSGLGAGAWFHFAKDTGVATPTGNFVGVISFGGVTDAYGTQVQAAAIAGSTEENYTSSSYKTGLLFETTSTNALTIAGGFTGDRDFYVGQSLSAGKFIVERATGTMTNTAINNSPVAILKTTTTGDDPTETVTQQRTTTTNNTQTTLATITLTASATTFVEAVVIARRTGGSAGTADDGAAYKLFATFQGGAQIGTTTSTVTHENQAGWDATIDYSANTARIRVTGATNNNITWHTTYRTYSVGS